MVPLGGSSREDPFFAYIAKSRPLHLSPENWDLLGWTQLVALQDQPWGTSILGDHMRALVRLSLIRGRPMQEASRAWNVWNTCTGFCDPGQSSEDCWTCSLVRSLSGCSDSCSGCKADCVSDCGSVGWSSCRVAGRSDLCSVCKANDASVCWDLLSCMVVG